MIDFDQLSGALAGYGPPFADRARRRELPADGSAT
jgi:hypothetical protein